MPRISLPGKGYRHDLGVVAALGALEVMMEGGQVQRSTVKGVADTPVAPTGLSLTRCWACLRPQRSWSCLPPIVAGTSAFRLPIDQPSLICAHVVHGHSLRLLSQVGLGHQEAGHPGFASGVHAASPHDGLVTAPSTSTPEPV